MNAPPFSAWTLRIEPLSPIHVGAGVTLDPYEYVLQVKDETGWLHAIDFPRLLSLVTPQERAEFDAIQQRGDATWIQLRQWVQRTAIRHPRCYRFTTMVMPTAFKRLSESLSNANRSCEIEMSYRHAATGVPYIPGSSIKGSIRTAVVSHFAHANPRRAEDAAKFTGNSSAKFEAVVLGHGESGGMNLALDPFRQVVIGDAALPSDGCYVDRVEVLRKAGARAHAGDSTEGILIYRDLIWSRCDEAPSRATAEFRLLHGLAAGAHLPRRLTITDLCRMCNEFYKPRLKGELREFPTEVEDVDIAGILLGAAESVASNQCIVRIGRHSHFECLTVGDRFSRRPAVRGRGAPPPAARAAPANPDEIRFGATRTYASGLVPLGWALLTFEPRA